METETKRRIQIANNKINLKSIKYNQIIFLFFFSIKVYLPLSIWRNDDKNNNSNMLWPDKLIQKVCHLLYFRSINFLQMCKLKGMRMQNCVIANSFSFSCWNYHRKIWPDECPRKKKHMVCFAVFGPSVKGLLKMLYASVLANAFSFCTNSRLLNQS